MGKTGVKAGGETQNPFFRVKTHSISEILAAGGATAFANQIGKKPQNIASRLKALPREAFLTNEEAASALDALKHHK